MTQQQMPKIHTHSSGEMGIYSNAYLVETDNGVVAIDSTLTVSESNSLKSKIEAIDKPLLAILLTHPHPDHVAGVTYLINSRNVSESIQIFATPAVDKIIRATEEPKRKQWSPVYKEQWISKWIYPNKIVNDNETVTFDGISYRIIDLGPGGDSDANSIWILNAQPKVAFVGDLVFNAIHSYIADNHLSDWLINIEKARELLADADRIYPGHGDAGSLELFDAQRAYLQAYSDAIRKIANGRTALTEGEKQQLTTAMEQFLHGNRLSFLIALSADAVAAELARNKS
ncbi:MAG: MBL fold metallo-hydrolase [Thermoproteota archaeon]|nr:MBL fold metallo-hydrolase [Thermoproteota archaeon]